MPEIQEQIMQVGQVIPQERLVARTVEQICGDFLHRLWKRNGTWRKPPLRSAVTVALWHGRHPGAVRRRVYHGGDH